MILYTSQSSGKLRFDLVCARVIFILGWTSHWSDCSDLPVILQVVWGHPTHEFLCIWPDTQHFEGMPVEVVWKAPLIGSQHGCGAGGRTAGCICGAHDQQRLQAGHWRSRAAFSCTLERELEARGLHLLLLLCVGAKQFFVFSS